MKHQFYELFFDVSGFLNSYQKKDIELCLEAIDENFKVETVNGNVVSKDWKDSEYIFSKTMNLVIKHLFYESDKTGFPKARKFCYIYFSVTDGINVKDIVLYFLNNKLSQLEKN